jgi:hypothetical protein
LKKYDQYLVLRGKDLTDVGVHLLINAEKAAAGHLLSAALPAGKYRAYKDSCTSQSK